MRAKRRSLFIINKNVINTYKNADIVNDFVFCYNKVEGNQRLRNMQDNIAEVTL